MTEHRLTAGSDDVHRNAEREGRVGPGNDGAGAGPDRVDVGLRGAPALGRGSRREARGAAVELQKCGKGTIQALHASTKDEQRSATLWSHARPGDGRIEEKERI